MNATDNSSEDANCNCQCHKKQKAWPVDLLPALIHFLETDLAGEELSSSIRPRHRDLLDRIRLARIAHCSTPTDNAARRRSSLQTSSSLLSSVVRRNKDLRSASPSHRLSLPSQAFSSYQPPNSKFDNSDIIEYESPNHTGNTLLLPSKQNNRASRRMSSFIEQTWSISGPLYYRSPSTRWLNPREASWQRFPHCVLHASRLMAHKSRGSTPALQLNLAGYTALYVEREGTMPHVIKLTHISLPTHVLAADTEEQARAWVQHLDSYSCTSTPPRNFSETGDFGAFYNLPAEVEPDSGFSGPHSSSSNSNESCEPTPTVYDTRDSPTRSIPARSASLSPSHSNSSPEPNLSRSLKSDSFMRRISSGFRDSLGSGRRKRNGNKNSFQNLQAAKDTVMSGVVNLKIPAVTQHWYRRWVQLRPNGHLEVFGLDSDGSGKLERQIFIGQLKLSTLQVQEDSRDKKHSSAMRFYTEDGDTDILYLEILDKLELARWIKALIQVMNLTPSYEPVMELIAREAVNNFTVNNNVNNNSNLSRRASLPACMPSEGDEESPVHRRPLPPVPGSITDLNEEENPYQIYDTTYLPPPGHTLACLATEESLSGSDHSANTSPATTLTKTDSLRARLMRSNNHSSLERVEGDLARLQAEVVRLRRQRSDLRREEASCDLLQDVTEEIERKEVHIETLRARSGSSSDPPEEEEGCSEVCACK